MDIVKLERANKLQNQIKDCEAILSSCIDHFVGREWDTNAYTNHYIPEKLNDQILELVKQYLEKYKKELKEL